MKEFLRMIVGLTGGIGSGKSLVAQFFRDLKIEVIDADQIARDLVVPGKPSFQEITKHFGSSILQKDGQLNRAKLRSIIFESPSERAWLENLLHPLIIEELLKISASIPSNRYAILEIPLLLEANFQDSVDRILVIDCPESMQIERISKRDGLPEKAIREIIKTQVDRKTRLKAANDVIANDGAREDLKSKVLALHHHYSELVK